MKNFFSLGKLKARLPESEAAPEKRSVSRFSLPFFFRFCVSPRYRQNSNVYAFPRSTAPAFPTSSAPFHSHSSSEFRLSMRTLYSLHTSFIFLSLRFSLPFLLLVLLARLDILVYSLSHHLSLSSPISGANYFQEFSAPFTALFLHLASSSQALSREEENKRKKEKINKYERVMQKRMWRARPDSASLPTESNNKPCQENMLSSTFPRSTEEGENGCPL